MLAILKRELKSYFLSPVGYVFLGIFLLISGFFFSYGNIFAQSSYFNGYLSNVLFIFLFVTPILTMRLLTEERKNKTDQLLLTSPLPLSSVIIGKFLSAVAMFFIALLITVSYAVVIAVFGDLDIMEAVCGYIGFLLIGSSFIAVGLFVSATTENQVSSAVITFCALIFIWLLDPIQGSLPATTVAGVIFASGIAVAAVVLVLLATKNIAVSVIVGVVGAAVVAGLYFFNKELFTGLPARVFAWFSLLKRNQSFSMGVLKLEDIVYYLSFIGAFIFLTVRLIEKRRWS